MINIQEKIEEFKKFYLMDERPWVLTFSGGKDSSTVLHLALSAYKQLHEDNKAFKPIYIVTSDTRVEMPIIEDYVNKTLSKIQNWIDKNKYDIHIKLITPKVEDTFWSKIIGRGYPSPTQNFRWCTDRMKIRPTTAYIENIAEKHGSIIMMLGVRSAESTNRAESIKKREVNHFGVTLNDQIKNAYTYSPIKDWSNEDVWNFISTFKSDWSNNEEMMSLYDKGSSEADCNIAIHPDNQSCGKTRFGCWVCTVVKTDKSLEGMIQNTDQKNLQKLSDLRSKLIEYREMDRGKREKRRRDGIEGNGPYTIEARKEFLIDLLNAEKELETRLIDDEEIIAIQKYWNEDGDVDNTAIKIAKNFGKLLHVKIEDSNKSKEFQAIYQIEKYRDNIGNRRGVVKDIIKRVKAISSKGEKFD